MQHNQTDSTTIHFRIANLYQEMRPLLEHSGIPESRINLMTMGETDLQELFSGLSRIRREEYESVRYIRALHTESEWQMLEAFGENNLREHKALKKAQSNLKKIWNRLEKRYAPPKPKEEVVGCDDVPF